MMSNATTSFDILTINLSILHNYFNGSTKLFQIYLYIAKFLDTLVKSFFLCVLEYIIILIVQ